MIKRIVDIGMTMCLLFLMAYQVTGEVLHEWTGMVMTVLVIVHQSVKVSEVEAEHVSGEVFLTVKTKASVQVLPVTGL